MFSTCLIALALSADATGTWTGTLAGAGSAHLILKQEANKLTGTAGPNAEKQMRILRGEAGGDGALRFELEEGTAIMKFSLRLDGDTISGDVVRENEGETKRTTLSVKRVADLASTVKALDKAMFDAYNACDLPKMKAYFASDVEFYHDQGGLMTGVDPVMEATKKNTCGKVRRELLTIEVYPIAGYGAVETGTHTFHNRSSGKEEGGQKAAKFLHIWQNKGGEWRLTRVVSYAH
jgi:ketosteroid isomerase-like protein